MRIERVKGKRLVAVLGEDEPVDLEVWWEIIEKCRLRKLEEVALVYPSRRFEEVRGFFEDVRRMTGRPCQAFSHARPKETAH